MKFCALFYEYVWISVVSIKHNECSLFDKDNDLLPKKSSFTIPTLSFYILSCWKKDNKIFFSIFLCFSFCNYKVNVFLFLLIRVPRVWYSSRLSSFCFAPRHISFRFISMGKSLIHPYVSQDSYYRGTYVRCTYRATFHRSHIIARLTYSTVKWVIRSIEL